MEAEEEGGIMVGVAGMGVGVGDGLRQFIGTGGRLLESRGGEGESGP